MYLKHIKRIEENLYKKYNYYFLSFIYLDYLFCYNNLFYLLKNKSDVKIFEKFSFPDKNITHHLMQIISFFSCFHTFHFFASNITSIVYLYFKQNFRVVV